MHQVANLLGVDVEKLAEVMTQTKRVVRGEEIFTPLDISQASDSRDSLCMNLYARTFKSVPCLACVVEC